MITTLHLKVLFWLAVAAWSLLLFIDGQSITANLFKPSSYVLSGMIVIMTIFEKWAWRFPLLYPWFVSTPNLRGVYEGYLNSHWVDPTTGKKRGEIRAFIVIRQSLSSIHVRLYTVESQSCSVVGSFIKKQDGEMEFLFNYCNEPRIENRPKSPIHYGSTRLTIGKENKHLEGLYWTDRQTTGEMKFSHISRETPSSFNECEELSTS